MYERVNFMGGRGSRVIDGQKHPNSQPPHSKEIGLWGGGRDSLCPGSERGDSARFLAEDTSGRTPDEVWVGQEDLELETDRKKGR